ncbi:19016_t:CDS:2 [Cetraspora pellucida]|uniref:19016_t:CDS:1 n=1 Tax=Cetraspora pellucida TaxID=1433469 RepID=A0A9N8ZE61_9GLOM|nr:19016_t:CDS:2 [Cetraspora pellucida]
MNAEDGNFSNVSDQEEKDVEIIKNKKMNKRSTETVKKEKYILNMDAINEKRRDTKTIEKREVYIEHSCN